MIDLTFQGNEEQQEEVYHKYWPEHRNIKNFEESHEERYQDRASAEQPELEFRDSSSKRSMYGIKCHHYTIKIYKIFIPEFLRISGWQG